MAQDEDRYRDDWENDINNNLPAGACYQFTMGFLAQRMIYKEAIIQIILDNVHLLQTIPQELSTMNGGVGM